MRLFLKCYILLFFIGIVPFLRGLYIGPPERYNIIHKNSQICKKKDNIQEKLNKLGKLKKDRRNDAKSRRIRNKWA